MRNKPYVRLIVIFGFSSLGAAMTNSLSFFFVKHVLLAGDLYGLYVAPLFSQSDHRDSAMVQVVARRIGKHRATMVAIGWYAFWSSFIPLIAVAPQAWFSGFRNHPTVGIFTSPTGTHSYPPTSRAFPPASLRFSSA